MLRAKIFLLLFASTYLMFSQEENISRKVASLQVKVEKSNGVDKLILLDSLSQLTKYKNQFNYEDTARQTIKLAVELDSINIAAKNSIDLILYLSRAERSEEGLKVFKDFSDKMEQVTDKTILIKLILNGAISTYYSGNQDDALKLYDQSKKLSLDIKDSTLYGRAMTQKAFFMSEMGRFVDASQEYQRALKIFDSQKDTLHALTNKLGLSILYLKNEFNNEAFEEAISAKDIALKTHNLPEYVTALKVISKAHFNSQEYHKTVPIIKEAIEISEKNPSYNPSITETYRVLANSYSKLDSIELAKKAIQKIQGKYDRTPTKEIELNLLESQMKMLFAEKNYALANQVGKKMLALEYETTKSYQSLLETLEILYKSNRALGNEHLDFYYFKEHTRINDSINNIKKINAFSYYQTLYESKKRENQIKNQITEIKLLDAKNDLQFQWMLIIGLTLFGISFFFYLNNKRNKQKAIIEKSKKMLTEQELKSTNLQNDLLNKEIEFKKKDLTNFAIEITQNQEWAKILLTKFENVKKASLLNKDKKLEELGNEIKDKIFVDIEFQDFYKNVEQLGSSFYEKLNNTAYNLSKTDIRLCSLIRLEINTKQIAILQNISPASVRTSKYRLRKKLHLKKHENLDTFIKDL